MSSLPALPLLDQPHACHGHYHHHHHHHHHRRGDRTLRHGLLLPSPRRLRRQWSELDEQPIACPRLPPCPRRLLLGRIARHPGKDVSRLSPVDRQPDLALTRRQLGVGVGSTAAGGIPVVDVDDSLHARARAQRGRPLADAHHAGAGVSAAAANSRKVSWSYLRGVSLALSELCQDCRYGGGRIPLAAILDLMRQHQSAFVPLGPHAEKDVPKRLIQLAHEKVVFFDPFEEYVIVLEEIRQKYASRRRELLAEGVDPADLSVFGAALTQDLSPSKRVTNAIVASYKEQFLLTQQQHRKKTSKSHAPTREESLMSIADAICPAALAGRPETELPDRLATRRGHSIVMDMAKIIGCQLREGSERSDCRGNESRCGFGRSVRQYLSDLYVSIGLGSRSRTLALCSADVSFFRLCRRYRRYLQLFTREMRWRLRTTACAPFLGYSS
ncbi:hypothetical protein BJV74DRAFT_58686 [Russula compacta]|nr:hypothetical protein BJV74DRAFT_58686 [Russula compacta]